MTDRMQPMGGDIRVGDFVVDPRSGELRNGAARQILSAQPLHVLLALAEHPGEVVTRDELRARLWPADTYVDFEHGLNAVVKRLRDALGDSADAPRYIETVPRRGYRLLAAVGPREVSPPPHPEPVTAAPAPAARGRRWSRVAAGMTVALAAVAAAGYALISGRPAEVTIEQPAFAGNANPVRLTFGPGLQTDPSWSPDGRRIAYAADRHGSFDLFTQSIDGGEPVRLTTGAANETQPAWSPDGKRIVFRSDEDGGGVFTIRLDDGAIRRIAGNGFQPLWMPDGRRIAFSRTEFVALSVVDAEGDEPPREILKQAMSNGSWFSFAVHPDGRIGLLGIHPRMRFGFYVSDREHRELRSVTTGRPLPESLFYVLRRAVWNRAGDAVFVEGRASGLPAIWRVPVDPATQAWGTPVQLATGPAGADHVAIAPDGTAAFTSAQATVRAWVFPFDADRGTPPGAGRAVTDEDASVSGLQLSADGQSIFYSEYRSGRDSFPGIQMRLDTGQTTTLYAHANSSPVPSPSGSGTSYQLYRTASGAPNDLEYALAWRSRDGRERLIGRWGSGAVHPTDVRRDDQVVLGTWMPTPYTGPAALAEWPIGPSAATEPQRVLLARKDLQFWQGRYSPDGRWVCFVVAPVQQSGLQMGVVPSSSRGGATWTRVAADHPWPDKPRWSPAGRIIYFVSRAGSGYYGLWGLRFDPERGAQAGAPFLIKAFDSPQFHIDPNLSPMEIGVANGVLALPMRSVKGSIWLLPTGET